MFLSCCPPPRVLDLLVGGADVSYMARTRLKPWRGRLVVLVMVGLSVQVVIVPIVKKEEDRVPVSEAAQRLADAAKAGGIRVKVRRAPRLACAIRTRPIAQLPVWVQTVAHTLPKMPHEGISPSAGLVAGVGDPKRGTWAGAWVSRGGL